MRSEMHRSFAAWLIERPWRAALACAVCGVLSPQMMLPFAIVAGAIPSLLALRFDMKTALSAAAAGAVAASTTTFEISTTATGELEARNQIILRNEVESETSIVEVIPEGTLVKKGDLLIKLNDEQIITQIDDRRHAGEVLQQDARRHEGDLFLQARCHVPRRERPDVVAVHEDDGLVFRSDLGELGCRFNLADGPLTALCQSRLSTYHAHDWPSQSRSRPGALHPSWGGR